MKKITLIPGDGIGAEVTSAVQKVIAATGIAIDWEIVNAGEEAYKETGAQGVSYTTGVPATIGARMFMQGKWSEPGVYNVEQFNPDPFMEQLNKQGLPWHELFDIDLEL